ncbi:2,3-bisphosphoglycerate-independent phosphoglycerate mutase [Aliihoeflea sp. 40Bstr573]|uniref:2,3-bisphosphoglycerate-independent phosphoglycerate mutase n=1 Tax=Aliihoeflea sp. 40Bstr573 TaxID=2696467 RepID=UPI002095A6ED|nr:2,3-bisphosphoglycerate-independent phosphoglycerate mutase [Aliihoeflea sp. 40Bstr573]MCO6386395.1 2,3-bisphosphoglycerate-independent phosphoglycerate mutase [Aliihoeflea sp. 40Bstr573]
MSAPVVLTILDGWGLSDRAEGNAVALAATPNFNRLWATWPHATLTTFGPSVGLPEGQMGNSEVGHLNIGAGRIVYQELPRINHAAQGAELAERLAATGLIDALKASGGTCHLAGLVSDGGVHAHVAHALALAGLIAGAGIPVAFHAFTDGRDTAPVSAPQFLADLERRRPEGAFIATVSGRYFAMDRDKRWERVKLAHDAMVEATGERAATASAALAEAQARGETDEFVTPTVIGSYGGMQDGDGLVFFNFRSDRAREILAALVDPAFDGFARPRRIDFAARVGMVSYGGGLDAHMKVLFEPQTLAEGLSETVSKAGLRQVHLAETEKYPHVTYFLNGGEEAPFPGEERVMVPSPKVATYDLKPEMSAPELSERVLEAIDGGSYEFVVVNFANPDMVGHTGDLDAAIRAVETVDAALGRIAAAVERRGGKLMIIADHGNCEEMIDRVTGEPHTAHTTNPVPVIVGPWDGTVQDGILADVAPTLLQLMGIAQPKAMTGRSLLR